MITKDKLRAAALRKKSQIKLDNLKGKTLFVPVAVRGQLYSVEFHIKAGKLGEIKSMSL